MKNQVFIITSNDDIAGFVSAIIDHNKVDNIQQVSFEELNDVIYDSGNMVPYLIKEHCAPDMHLIIIIAFDTDNYDRDMTVLKDTLIMRMIDPHIDIDWDKADIGTVAFCPGIEELFHGDAEQMKQYCHLGLGTDGKVLTYGINDFLKYKVV